MFGGTSSFSYGSSFTTGDTSSILSSITVVLANGGYGSGFTLTLNQISSGLPGAVIETLSGNSSPTTAASYTFTSSGVTLAANTTYAIVASAGSTPDASFNMHRTVSNGQTGSTGWTIGDSGFQDSDGWYADPAKIVFSVSATSAVPEPSTYAVIFGALALGAVGIVRRRRAATAKA